MRKFRGSRKGKFPIALGAGVGIGLGMSALGAWYETPSSGNAAFRGAAFLDALGQRIYGYSAAYQKMTLNKVGQFWAPVAGGVIAHTIAAKTGINRLLAKHVGIAI